MTKKSETAGNKTFHDGYQPTDNRGYQPKQPSNPQGGTSDPQGGYTPETGQSTNPTPPKKP